MADKPVRGLKASPAADQITIYGRTNRATIHRDFSGNAVERRLDATGSSDLEDLIGDRMLPSMLEDMRQFEPGSAIFSNHLYVLPYSAVGILSDYPHLEVVTAVKDTPFVKAGQQYMEMAFSFDILPNNPEAVTIYDYIKEYGLKVGTSVGVQITEYSVRRDDDGYPLGLDIIHGLLLEISTVGIPCNFQSWVKSAVTGLQRQYGALLPLYEPKELRYMARHWGDVPGDIDQLVLSRINRSLTTRDLDLVEFDDEDRKTLTSLDAALRQSGLYIERLPAA